jgi:hypothetical protein
MTKSFLILKGVFTMTAFLVLIGCAGSPNAASNPDTTNDISGIWFCELETGEIVEISFDGNNYAIKINGVNNNRGVFTLSKVNTYDYIIFEIQERFDINIEWKRMTVRYRIEDGNFILEGNEYRGTYTKQ